MSYLYGQALENSSADFDEAILILLEMLRFYFPAGSPIDEVASHSEFSSKFTKSSGSDDDVSVRLLSRVFSLLNLNFGAQSVPYRLKSEQIDFDLALFASYTNMFKRVMQYVF